MEENRNKKRGRKHNRGGRKLGDLHLSRRFYLYLKHADKYSAVLVVSLLFLLIISFGLLLSLFITDWVSSGTIFQGISIDGKPVGGMSREQATEYVNKNIVNPLGQSLVLVSDDEEFNLDPRGIGVSFDVNGMVESAYWTGAGQGILTRMYKRFTGETVPVDIPVMMKYDEKKLATFIQAIAQKLASPPRNASISMSDGVPEIVDARDGCKVNEEKTTKAVIAALPKNVRRVPVVCDTVEPDVTNGDIRYIVVVKLSEHILYLYNQEELFGSYSAAVGSPEYPTPTGKFYVVDKEKDPTWIPPKSDWAKDAKPIPPGPGNPLGPYWINLGGGVGIHSTPDSASLGYSVSHGCIRLSEWSAMQVFERVNKGTPVYILP